MPSNLLLIRRKIKFIKKSRENYLNKYFLYACSRLSWHFSISSSSSTAFLYHQLVYSFFYSLVFFLIFKLLSMSSIKMEEKFMKRKLLKMEKFCEFMIFLFCWSHIIVGIYHHHWNFFHSIWSHFASSLTGILAVNCLKSDEKLIMLPP